MNPSLPAKVRFHARNVHIDGPSAGDASKACQAAVTPGWAELRRLNGVAYPHSQSPNLNHIPGGYIATAYFRPQPPPELEFDTDTILMAAKKLRTKAKKPRNPPGPKPEVLKIEGKWKDAMRKLISKKRPVCGELLILGKSVIRHTQEIEEAARFTRRPEQTSRRALTAQGDLERNGTRETGERKRA